jgi:uncharacterized protein (DUF1015 family)
MFITRIRLQPFSEGSILPHEQTFGGPKEDRLALMKTTKCQLSPIFGLYTDPEDRIGSAFAPTTADAPNVTATLDGVVNRMWIVTDAGVIDSIISAMADKKIYIADGHHRYLTALNYRDWLARESGGLSSDHPANFALLTLAGMDDPGNLILPTHRVLVEIPDVSLDRLMETWKPACTEAPPDQADLSLFDGQSGQTKHVRFNNRSALAGLEPDKSDAWCQLDLAYLHRYLIDELFNPTLSQGNPPKIRYAKAREDAQNIAREEKGIALICKATTMAQLQAVGEAGDLMPPKSTYFFPKAATGLVINPLE